MLRVLLILHALVLVLPLVGADGTSANAQDYTRAWTSAWVVSSGGSSKWQYLNTSIWGPRDAAFADFTGDGKADVFRTDGGKWFISDGGTESWREINTSAVRLRDLAFADLTGDGKADVFRTDGGKWFISDGGTGSWREINTSAVRLQDLAFADFDGDRNADVLTSFRMRLFGLEVSRFNTATLTNGQADGILRGATYVLRAFDAGEDVSCLVHFDRTNAVTAFAVGNGIVNSRADFNQVIGLPGNVKLVNQINWCGGPGIGIIGCAPIGGTSFAVVRFTANQEGILWAHEFGHNQGIVGDYTTPNRVMNGTITANNRRVTSAECDSFRR